MIRRFVAIWASCLAAPVDLDAVKRRVQESTMCRDLGILFEGSVDLDHLHTSIRENMIFCSKNNEFLNEFSMKMNDFVTFCGSSIHREQQKR